MLEAGDVKELEAAQLDVLTKIQALTRQGKLSWSQKSMNVRVDVTKRISASFEINRVNALTAAWKALFVFVNDEKLIYLYRERGTDWKEKLTEDDKRLIEIADDIFQRVVAEPQRVKAFEALNELRNL